MNYKSKEEQTKPWIKTEQSNESQSYFQHSFIHINSIDDLSMLSKKPSETNIIDTIRLTNKSIETPSKNPLYLPALIKDSTQDKNGCLEADINSMELTNKITSNVSTQLSDKNDYQETNRDSTKLTDRITAEYYDSYISPKTSSKILSNLSKSTKVKVLDRGSIGLNYKTYYNLYKEALSKRRGSETDDTTKNKSKYKWTHEQEQTLLQAVNKHGEQWRLISKTYFDSARTKGALRLRYNGLIPQRQEDRATKSKSKYNLWTHEQEQTLLQAVNKH
ncbi:390_t:CDS:1, partial [Diversispora eburnea]